jgi:ethanolamine utilization protein EutQ (cupin superfamily)
MIKIIDKPAEIKASGNKEKIIEEFIGRVNSNTVQLSIAKMTSPEGWEEPGQTPEFDEYTIVLKGCLRVETKDKSVKDIMAGQAVIVNKNEWIKYSTPFKDGAEYIAVCLPAFSPDLVHRDEYKTNFFNIIGEKQ